MNFIGVSFCFDLDSLSGDLIADIIEEGIGFLPTRIRSNQFAKAGTLYKANSHLNKLRNLQEIESLELYTEDDLKGSSFRVTTIGDWSMQVIYWKTLSVDIPSNELIKKLTATKGFNAGCRCDDQYQFWESTELINTYEVYNRPYGHLPLMDDEIFEKKVDVSSNPGRRTAFPGMWLCSCFEMWFGKGFFKYVPKERVQSFPNAKEIKEIGLNAVYLRLHDDIFAAKENKNVLQYFRDWTGMDELAEQNMAFAEGSGDPCFEMNEGAFPNGGVRMLIQWMNHENELVRRSKATKKIESELSSDGGEIAKTETLIGT